MYETQRDNVFALKLFSASNRELVFLLESDLGKIFNHRDEDVFGVVLLEI